MKRVGLGFLVLLLFLSIGWITAFGNTTIPGSTEDPVVTKSYVDSKLAYQVLQLQVGQIVIGGEGTEIIVRSGEVTAIDNGANGISDITGGQDLRTGQLCKTNHLLLVPRNDGRGVKALTEAYIMVRGSYTLN
jgi:hypothetical protein